MRLYVPCMGLHIAASYTAVTSTDHEFPLKPAVWCNLSSSCINYRRTAAGLAKYYYHHSQLTVLQVHSLPSNVLCGIYNFVLW